MKKSITILLTLFSLSVFGQSGGADHFKLKTGYLQVDSLSEITPVLLKVLVADENGNIGYTSNISGAVTSVNGYSGDVNLSVTDLSSDDANSGDVPVADGSGGISWEAQTGGTVVDPVTLISDDPDILLLTGQHLDFVSSNIAKLNAESHDFTGAGSHNFNGIVNTTGYQLNGAVLNADHLSSLGAVEGQVPIANNEGGITWGNLDLNVTTDGIWLKNNVGDNNEHIAYAKNVVIGTFESQDNNNLFVHGTVNTREVIVTLGVGVPVPDYVFEKGYKLKPLSEVEEYVNKNKHLPEIPSAKEVGESGLNLSEMNLLLLKKVEELTLYMIEQQKEIELLKAQVNK